MRVTVQGSEEESVRDPTWVKTLLHIRSTVKTSTLKKEVYIPPVYLDNLTQPSQEYLQHGLTRNLFTVSMIEKDSANT